MGDYIPNQETQRNVGDLVGEAKTSLVEFFEFPELRREQWFMRVSVGGRARGWELLTMDSEENNKIIKQRIREGEAPVADLVLGFIGLIQWRGRKQLMAHMQYFRRDHPTGLLFGSHVRQTLFRKKLRRYGAFLIMGSCQNVWF